MPKHGKGFNAAAAKIDKTKVARLTKEQVREIAEVKLPDLNANDIDAAKRQVEGTARSMGITVS